MLVSPIFLTKMICVNEIHSISMEFVLKLNKKINIYIETTFYFTY